MLFEIIYTVSFSIPLPSWFSKLQGTLLTRYMLSEGSVEQALVTFKIQEMHKHSPWREKKRREIIADIWYVRQT